MTKSKHIKIKLLAILCLFASFLQGQQITCVRTDNTNPNSVFIAWDAPAIPCGPFQNYEVWGSTDPNAAFQLIGTITTETQTDFVHNNAFLTGDPWYYFIIYNYNCPGVPALVSETASNAINSFQPEIESLRLTDAGVEVTWAESEFPQTQGYVMAVLEPSGLDNPFDTVFGITTTSYLDVINNPEDPDLIYVLEYLDGCPSISQFNTQGYSLINFVGEPNQDGCEQLITLEWIPYNNPYDVEISYNVLIQVNNEPWDTITGEAGPFYNFFDFIDGDSIRFQVEVIDENGIFRTNSPLVEIEAQIVQPPREFYIYNLTVTNDNLIDISFFVDSLAELRNITVNNSEQVSDITNQIERFDADVVPLGNIVRTDSVSNADEDAFYYQIVVNDSCNTDHFSTVGRTIFLDADLNDFFENIVTFNAFELENAEVVNYRLYRDYGAGFQFTENIVPSGLSTFEVIDNVSEFVNQRGSFCYKVEAEYVYTFPGDSTAVLTSQSNTNCIDQRPSVYIPNAIVPNGTNREFKPLIVYSDPSDFNMKIFSRWGELIFETNSFNTGWFGTKNGKVVPTGGYPYVISFTSLDGTKVEKKGIVTVIN